MSSATTRVTIVGYIDEQGQKQLELPGWGPSIQGVIDSGIEPNFILGQLWLERPYRSIAEAPEMLTIVDLRSTDGNQRMVQEFEGHVVDLIQLKGLVGQRLGAEMFKWRLIEAFQFVRGAARDSGASMEPGWIPLEQSASITSDSHAPISRPLPKSQWVTWPRIGLILLLLGLLLLAVHALAHSEK